MPMVAASCSYLSSPWSPAPPVRPSPGMLPRPSCSRISMNIMQNKLSAEAFANFPKLQFLENVVSLRSWAVGDIASFVRSPRRRSEQR